MKTSRDRILTTHTGSLPRPADLGKLLAGESSADPEELDGVVDRAVREVVGRQIDVGLDVISDGEMSKPSYATYVSERLTGFSGRGGGLLPADLAEYPGHAARLMSQPGLEALQAPQCTGRVEYADRAAVDRDIDRFKRAAVTTGAAAEELFMTAASPGVVSLFHENVHYGSDQDYLEALADALRTEYEAIIEAGLLLQLDCPDLAMGRHIQFGGHSLDAYLHRCRLNVEALNHAVANIPPERMRIHVCWGNYEGPHHRDVRLRNVIDPILAARPAGISIAASNPRHGHEWRLWESIPLPEGKILIPGVIDPTTNFIEHPDLVADRITRIAALVGPRRVIAGTDCGFGTFAGFRPVDPEIAWAKLGALVEGARRASESLY